MYGKFFVNFITFNKLQFSHMKILIELAKKSEIEIIDLAEAFLGD